MVLYKDKILFFAYLASLLLLVVGFSLVYVDLFDAKTLLIIHFNPFSGIDFLGEHWDVYGILLAGVIINLLDGFLSVVLYYRERFLSRLLGFAGGFLSLLILLAIIVIVGVN